MRHNRNVLLPLVCLLVFASFQASGPPLGTAIASAGGQGGAACPVTTQPDRPLTPPQEFLEFIRNGIQPPELREHAQLLAPNQFWYGNDALWLALPVDGVLWNTKQPWWRAAPGRLRVQGQRLDLGTNAPSVTIAQIPDGYGERGFQASGWAFPEPGCWEVSAAVDDRTLVFVTSVVTLEMH